MKELLEKRIKICNDFSTTLLDCELLDSVLADKLDRFFILETAFLESLLKHFKSLPNEPKVVRNNEDKKKVCTKTKGLNPCTDEPIDSGCEGCKFLV